MERAVDVTSERPVREGLIAIDPPALIAAQCAQCGGLSFPRESHCPFCGADDPDEARLPSAGTIYSFTIVRFAAPGYAGPVPYAVGIVELDGRIRVASTLLADPLESLRIGAEVRFTPLEVDSELSYAHELVAP